MYIKQLIATEDTAIIMPGIVRFHPTVSITDAGHNMYMRSVSPTQRTPPTPNQIRVSTMLDTMNPKMPAASATCREVKTLTCPLQLRTPNTYH